MSKLRMTMAAAAAATVMSLPVAAQAQVTYNLWNPPSAIEYKDGLVPYFKRVEEKTGGKFKPQIFTAGQMFGPMETLGGIKDGAVAGGFVFEQFYVKDLPQTYMINETNGFNDDVLAASGASQDYYFNDCPSCLDEAEKTGVIMLGGHSTLPYLFLCRNELKSVDDLVGKRIRGTTAFHNAIINAFGGVGVNVSFAEITQAVERGTLDCMVGTESWITGFGLTEMIKSTVPVPNFGSLPTAGFITFNRGAWDGFEPEVRKALVEEMPGYIADVTMAFIEQRDDAVAKATRAGMKEVDLGEGYQKKYDAWKQAERARVIDAAKARGDNNAEAFLDGYLAKYEEWKELTADIGNDREKFRQLLWDRIYSKVKY